SLVGLLGAAEPGILAHGPEAPAIHARLHTARERLQTGKAQLRIGLAGRVERLQLDAAGGAELLFAQRRLAIDLARPLLQRRHLRTPSAQKIAYQKAASGLRAHRPSSSRAKSKSAAPSSPAPTMGSRA